MPDVKALNALKTSPQAYYKGLQVSKIEDALQAPELSLTRIMNSTSLTCARAAVVIAISEVVMFFNVGKTMNATQVAMTADLIIEKYGYFNMEDLKLAFKRAMYSSRVFDILGWLRDYDLERTAVIEQQRINEQKEHERQEAGNGMFYHEYLERLRAKAKAGDEEARKRLDRHNELHKRLANEDKEADFKRWREEYNRSKAL